MEKIISIETKETNEIVNDINTNFDNLKSVYESKKIESDSIDERQITGDKIGDNAITEDKISGRKKGVIVDKLKTTILTYEVETTAKLYYEVERISNGIRFYNCKYTLQGSDSLTRTYSENLSCAINVDNATVFSWNGMVTLVNSEYTHPECVVFSNAEFIISKQNTAVGELKLSFNAPSTPNGFFTHSGNTVVSYSAYNPLITEISINKLSNNAITDTKIANETIDTMEELKRVCNESAYNMFLSQRSFLLVNEKSNDSSSLLKSKYTPYTIILRNTNIITDNNITYDEFEGEWE